MKIVSRREAITALGGGLALTITPVGNAMAQAAALRISVIPIFDVAPLFAAQAQGYLAAEGLTVSTDQVVGGTVGIPGIVSGDYDIAYSNAPSVVLALDRGIDLRIMIQGSGVADPPPAPVALIKRAGDPIRTGKDLEGKAIAVNALSNIQWMIARSWVKATGGNPDKVTYLEFPIPAQLEAVRSKRVDAAMATDPFLTIGLEQPQDFALLDWAFNRVYPDGPAAFWVTSGAAVQTKAPALRAFLRAYRRGVAWVNANRGQQSLFALVAGYSHLDAALLAKITIPRATFEVRPKSFPQLLNLMRDNGLLKNPIDLNTKVFNA